RSRPAAALIERRTQQFNRSGFGVERLPAITLNQFRVDGGVLNSACPSKRNVRPLEQTLRLHYGATAECSSDQLKKAVTLPVPPFRRGESVVASKRLQFR